MESLRNFGIFSCITGDPVKWLPWKCLSARCNCLAKTRCQCLRKHCRSSHKCETQADKTKSLLPRKKKSQTSRWVEVRIDDAWAQIIVKFKRPGEWQCKSLCLLTTQSSQATYYGYLQALTWLSPSENRNLIGQLTQLTNIQDPAKRLRLEEAWLHLLFSTHIVHWYKSPLGGHSPY